jgi:heme exporter protein A
VPGPLLVASNLERRFGALRVLRGVSLAVGSGECHLIVGPNGAGKTTLLRLLAGLARPSAGRVTWRGEPIAGDPAVRRHLGLLSHQSHLYDDLTAVENLTFAGKLYGLQAPGALARQGLERMGLSRAADEPVRRLSRGMVQRVAIARSLLHDPDVLLLDEPFTGLDPDALHRVAGLLLAERARGRGLVLVSHEVHGAWEIATHTHVLLGGIWAHSSPREPAVEDFTARYREMLRG